MDESRRAVLQDQRFDHSIGARIVATGAPPHFGKRYFSASAAGFASVEELMAGLVDAGRIAAGSPAEMLLGMLGGCRPERGMTAGRPLLEGELFQLRVDGCGRAERAKVYMRPHRLAMASYVMDDLATTLVGCLFGSRMSEEGRGALVAEIMRRHRAWPIRLIALAVPAGWGGALLSEDAAIEARIDWIASQVEIETYHDSDEAGAMMDAGQAWITRQVGEVAHGDATRDLTATLARVAARHGLSLCFASRDLYPGGTVPGDGDTSVSVCTPPAMDLPAARKALDGFLADLAGIPRIPPLMPRAVDWCFAGMGPGRREPSMLDALTVKIPAKPDQPAEVFLVVKPVWLAELM